MTALCIEHQTSGMLLRVWLFGEYTLLYFEKEKKITTVNYFSSNSAYFKIPTKHS